METETINPDCEIEQLLFHMKINGIKPNSSPGRILLWLEKRGPGDYSVANIAEAISLSVRRNSIGNHTCLFYHKRDEDEGKV